MTDYSDWRVGPDPLKCVNCQGTESACDNKRCFAGRCCCESCDHEQSEVVNA